MVNYLSMSFWNSFAYFSPQHTNKILHTFKKIKNLSTTIIKKSKIEEELKKKFLGLNIETINICNANCIFCAYQYQKRPTGTMDTKLFETLIADYAKIGGGLLGLTPTVGEPLADTEIVERIKYARSFKEIKQIGFFSNLISLGLHNLNDFINSGITSITVSTSGLDESMYKRVYRSVQYQKMYNNLTNLLIANKKNNYPINIVIDMRSDKSLNETTNFKDYKNILKYSSKDNFFYKFRYDDWIGKIKQSDLIGRMKIRNMFSSLRFRISPCFEYFNGPMVYWNGDVGICGCRDVDAKELIIGNIKNTSIKDIWYNSKHLDYLNNFIKRTPEICKKCTHYDNISVYQNSDWKEKIKQHKNIY